MLRITIIFGFMIFIGFLGCQRPNESLIVVKSNVKDVSQADIARLKKEAVLALDKVGSILDVSIRDTLEIVITNFGICNAMMDRVSIPIRAVNNKTAVVIHEVTHILTLRAMGRLLFDHFYSEGIGVYFQKRFGSDRCFFETDTLQSLHDIVANIPDSLRIPLVELANDPSYYQYSASSEDREKNRDRIIAYKEAGSFYKYIIETYGEDKLRILHHQDMINYKEVFDKDLAELEVEWKDHVFNP
jgi:hypothetical protein